MLKHVQFSIARFKWLSILLTIVFFSPSFAQQDISGSYQWSPIRIGGTGFVTGLISSSTDPNLRYARTDVGGFYKWNAEKNEWIQLLTADRFSDIDRWQDEPGVESIALAGDNTTFYVATLGRIYRSTNGGESFSPTDLSLPMAPNGILPSNGERLVVSPSNANRAFFGSRENGLWQTSNGTSWSRVQGIADGTDGVGIVTVKYSVDGEKLYAGTSSQGIFESSDDGASWSKITGSANTPADSNFLTDIDVDQSGRLLVSYFNDGSNSGGVWIYDGNAWTQASPLNHRNFVTVSVDPFDNDRIIAATEGVLDLIISNDGGVTWRSLSFDRSSPDIPWAERVEQGYFTTDEIYFDPSTPNRIYTGQGIGVWKADVSEAALADNKITFEFESRGIEELVTSDILVRPGKPLVTFGWDVTGFVHNDLDDYTPIQIFPDDFSIGWDGTFRRNDTDFIATNTADYLQIRGALNHAGFTTDGGATWQKFGSIANGNHPAELQYGAIAASNVSAVYPQSLVWLPATDGRPYFTDDNGMTWQKAIGWPTDGNGNDSSSGLFNRNFRYQGLTADVQEAGKYLMTTGGGKLLNSTDGGRNWNVLSSDLPLFGFNGQLEQDWTDANTLWYAHGRQENDPAGIYRSLDGGLSFDEVGDFTDTIDISLGAPLSDGDPLSVYVLGTLFGREGIYRSLDDGVTWDFIGQFPLGVVDQPLVLAADPDKFGRIYLGTSGTGFFYGDIASASDPCAGPILLGDCNLDDVVDFSDIPPFIELLTTGSYLQEADCNQDGAVDFSDIASFIDILLDGCVAV